MTSDFKDKILKWLTGNYTVDSGSNVPQFSIPSTKTNDLNTELNDALNNDYFINGTLQGNDMNNNGVGYTVIYGIYNAGSGGVLGYKGFICILDEDFDILQIIKEYSSGTEFGLLKIMGVGDDGNFFLIETTSSNVKRFVMLNNIIAKLPTDVSYKVVLRKSYNLSGSSVNIETFTNLIKAPEQSRYIIAGNDTNQKVIATELVVNVGSSNEWNDYTYTTNMFTIGDIWASWDNEGNLTFKLAGFKITNADGLTYGELAGSSSSVGTLSLTTYGSGFQNAEQYSLKKPNSTTAYFGIIQYDYINDATIKIYMLSNGSLSLLKTITTTYDPSMSITLYRIDTEIFCVYNYFENDSSNWKIVIGKIIDNNIYEEIIYSSLTFENIDLFMVQKQFNLYNYFVQIGDMVHAINQVYNSLNYNGIDYQALNSLVPNSAILSSNSKVIFARNLYNKVVNENTTISTLNVPNNFINGITIDNESLYGETNTLLVESEEELETNIYEELMFNFVNTLIMRNENDINNKIENLNGAIRLNNSISNLKDYDNCKLTKCKINYSDNTSITNTITSNEIVRLRGVIRYVFGISVPSNKDIVNIQLISNDENTLYLTINGNSLERGKSYKITQDVYIV